MSAVEKFKIIFDVFYQQKKKNIQHATYLLSTQSGAHSTTVGAATVHYWVAKFKALQQLHRD